MSNNKVAKKLKTTGDIMVLFCYLFALIIGTEHTEEALPLFFGLIITALVGSLILFAFAEIIILLQKNANKQDEVLYYLKAMALKENAPPKQQFIGC